ncbi:MAG TPA: hypothetical protein VJ553_06445, partial [Candidatus Paceibacterota bacterium]|nr:hypothetical protein [Candidatus Paceibacterota bacterium]
MTFTWAVEGLSVGEYTLSSTTGASVTFSATVEGVAWLNASASLSGHSASGSAAISVTSEVFARSVDYYWSDMFEVPFEDYWLNRSWSVGGSEEIISEPTLTDPDAPNLFVWKSGSLNTWTYTNMNLDVAARNISEINTTVNPWFIPLLNETIRGGHAYVDFYMDYGTYDELLADYGDTVANQCDGWLTIIKGTVTMDEIASMSMFNMTSEDFDGFDTWWAENGAAKTVWYQQWLNRQGNVVYDVFNAYEYPLVFLAWPEVMQAEKVGDEVVLHYDYVTWGMEVLFTRWLRHSFMNTEWYFENFHLQADIGPERADVDLTTGVEYAAYAYETTEDGKPCWMWEALLQDILPRSLKHPISDYEPYDGLTYLNTAPGSWLYGEWMPYDYAPGVQNLSEGDRMTITWPDGDILFQVHVEPGVYENITGPMTMDYSEPMWTDPDLGGQVLLDSTNRTLTFVGPMDLWNWSKEQTTHENLANEWERLGLLPYGAPTIEFRYDAPAVMDNFLVENYTSPVMAGTSSAFDVIAQDEVNMYYPDYIGTIEILTNDSTAVITQSTFDVTDVMNGLITIPNGTVTFNSLGVFALTVRDTIDNTIVGDMLVEVTEPPGLDHFGVVLSAAGDVYAVETLVDVTVTAYLESGAVYTDYVGEVTFTSSDLSAFLPLNYTFTVGDAGTHAFVEEIFFLTDGDQTVTVTDTSDGTKSGVSDPITVLPMAWPTYITLSGISSTPTIAIAETVIVTVYDQYDRV